MDCSPQALAIAAACFTQCLGAAQLDAIETYLSCQIANSGGGGGGGTQVYISNYGGVAPVFVPLITPSIAFDTSTGPPYQMWTYNGSAWV